MGTAVIEQVDELKMRIHFVKEQHPPPEEVGEGEVRPTDNDKDDDAHVVPEKNCTEELTGSSTELVQREEEEEKKEKLCEAVVVAESESASTVDFSVIDDILNTSDELQTISRNDKKRDEKFDFDCPICRKTFGLRWNLVAHMRIHTGERPFKCQQCSNGFKQYAHLKKHMRLLHPGTTVPPPQRIRTKNIPISKISPPPRKRIFPLTVSEPEECVEDPYKKFNIRECEVALSRFDVDNDKPVSTSLILQKFNSMASRTQGQDLLLQLNAEGRKCVVKMDTDLLAHFLQPIFPPPAPSSAGVVRVNLNSHDSETSTSPAVRIKSPEPMMKNVLQPGLVKRGRGRPRKNEVNGPSSLNFKCIKCKKRCTSQSTLYLHNLRYHSDNMNRSQMNKSVSNNTSVESLGGHVQTKNVRKVGSLGCTICARTFLRLDVLKKHLQLHSGERSKAFQCPTCLKCFLSSTYLVYHMRTHSGERPYSCNECKKRFTRSDTLKNHMRLHTGERPYPCLKCEERFIQFSRLQMHMKKYHSSEMACYRCAICLASFFDEASLTAHSVSH